MVKLVLDGVLKEGVQTVLYTSDECRDQPANRTPLHR